MSHNYVMASIRQGMDDKGLYGELVITGIANLSKATETRRSLFRSAKDLGYLMVVTIEVNYNDTYQVRFKAIDKERAIRYRLSSS